MKTEEKINEIKFELGIFKNLLLETEAQIIDEWSFIYSKCDKKSEVEKNTRNLPRVQFPGVNDLVKKNLEDLVKKPEIEATTTWYPSLATYILK